MTKFFLYSQNNSGGFFDQLDNGSHDLIVEANTANEANDIATEYGIYFNGCDSGADCDCCGDRWYAQDDSDAYDTIEEIHNYQGAKIVRK